VCELDLRDLRDGIRLRCIFSVPSHSAVEETPLRCILSVPTHSAVQSSIHGFNQLPILRSSRVVLVCAGRVQGGALSGMRCARFTPAWANI